MSVVVPQSGQGSSRHSSKPSTPSSKMPSSGLRAYSDPVIFRDDRVLRTLLRKEHRYIPESPNYFSQVQTEVKAHMRKEVADWMLEVCEDQRSQPEVFCLAMNYFDRFLSLCAIGRSQLQLLGAVCLLVAWKVREHEPLPAIRLVEYSDFNLTLLDIMEWEVLLLSKLDWDMSAVIASDFVEHIIQRVCRLLRQSNANSNKDGINAGDPAVVRKHAETLITMCSAHHSFSALSPSLVAAAAVITAIRPMLEAAETAAAVNRTQGRREETPSPSSSSSSSSLSPNRKSLVPDLASVLDAVEKFALIDKMCLREVMDQIEILMRASLPPSPAPSPTPPAVDAEEEVAPVKSKKDSSNQRDAEGDDSNDNNAGEDQETPTKVLEAARRADGD